MLKAVLGVIHPFALIISSLSWSCLKSIDTEYDVDASAQNNGPNGQRLRCQTIYPSVERVAVPVLRRIVDIHLGRIPSGMEGRRLAGKTVNMLRNMVRHPVEPIHPLGFFSVVKDFESSEDVSRWGQNGFGFTTGNCSSGVCSGYFQVDVALEGSWRSGQVCKGGELGVWHMPGGPDFCAALFWWLEAAGGTKCSALDPGNPCLDPEAIWTLDTFARGYQAYVQTPQWGDRSWGKMYRGEGSYSGYRQCIAGDGASIRPATDVFLRQIGLIKPEDEAKKCQPHYLFSSAKPNGRQFQVEIPPECPADGLLVYMKSKNSTSWVQVGVHPGDGSSVPKAAQLPIRGGFSRFFITSLDLAGLDPVIQIHLVQESGRILKFERHW